MKSLDDHIAPDEPVLWRSPTLRDWLVDQAKLMILPGALAVLPFLLSSNPVSIAGAVVCALVTLMLVAGILPRNPSETMLTGRQILFRSGLRNPKIIILERPDINRLEIFGGDGTLVLSGRHEELCRPVLLGEPLELARALDVPTTYWKPYEPTSWLWRLNLYLTMLVVLAALGLTSGLVFSLPESFWETIRTGISDLPFVFALASALGIITVGAIPSTLVVALLVGILKRWFYPRDELNRMRCYKFNPLWRGKDPASVPATGPRALLRTARLGFDRLINGPLPDCAGIEAEQYRPGAFPPPEEDGGN